MRISVVGTSGSGKTTVGRAAAERLGTPFLELDSIRHQAGWVELDDEEFRRRTAELTAAESWVVDGNYAVVRDVVEARATTIVWLDLPKAVVMAQVSWRSFTRAALRRELWNGNRESMRRWLDPEHPIRWAWSTHDERRRTYGARADGDDRWLRLRSRREIDRWLATLASGR